MASNPSVLKRERERNRQEKQRQKEAKRQQRKTDKESRPPGSPDFDPDLVGFKLGVVPIPQ